MKSVILLFGLFCLLACSKKPTSSSIAAAASSIIGGKAVTSVEAISHFAVALYDKRTGAVCTGTVLKENLILTAAHCIESAPSNIVIIFGLDFSAFDNGDTALLRTADQIEIHPDFKKNSHTDMNWDDIALIRFSGGLPPGYKPVSLLPDEKVLQRGTSVTLAGYGSTGVEMEEVTKRDRNFKKDLEAGEIVCSDPYQTTCFYANFTGDDNLQSTSSIIEGFTEKEIRLNGNKGHGTCVGDSGGPLIYDLHGELYVVGVTSRGSPLCDGPAIYTNTLKYMDWIEKTAANLK